MDQTKKEDHTVIMSDKYLEESGVQGGKAIAEHISLGSFIIGIPFFIVGCIALIAIALNTGFPSNAAIVIGSVLLIIIGLLLTLGGYIINRDKHSIK